MASLADLQKLQGMLDRRRSAAGGPVADFARLTRELGEVGEQLGLWHERVLELAGTGMKEAEARRQAFQERQEKLGLGLAHCLALLIRLANGAGASLEECYQLELDKAMRT